jgi:DNA-binding transcriptional ArsR family regulator/uncharacterized Zn finger protein
MTDGDADADEGAGEGFPVEEAFALIGHRLRAEVLRVLGEHPHEGLSFSELRERVDADVDSGQFNYHLRKLVGHFVEQGEDGYVLRPAGLALYRAIRSGTFTQRVALEPLEVGFDCYHCGSAVEVTLEDGWLEMTCSGCGHVYTTSRLPPSAVEGDRDSLLARLDQYNRHRYLAATHGVCPVCASELSLEFVRGEELDAEGADRHEAFVRRHCSHCGRTQYLPVGMTLLYHPVVVSFYHDHGRDLTTVPHWNLEWAMTDDSLTVRSADPWAFELRVPCDDEVLEVVVDDELSVVASSRRPREGAGT